MKLNAISAIAADRVRALAEDLGVNLNGRADGERVQFWYPSLCHSANVKKSLSIGTHDSDDVPSADGFPLLHCFVGCDYGTIRAALVKAGASPELLRAANGQAQHSAASVPERRASSTAPSSGSPPPVVPMGVWLRYHDDLLRNHDDRLGYLHDEKGLTLSTVEAMCIGWSEQDQRYSIPVFNDEGRCVNLRLYLPHAKPDDDKMRNYWRKGEPSYGRNRLYVPGEYLDSSRRTLHCAGELDAILGWQHGWQTTTQTGGERSHFPKIDAARMKGQNVHIAYDNDDDGRTGSEGTAKDLDGLAASIHVVDLSALDLDDKGDLGDVWRRPDLGSPAVRQVVDHATAWGEGTKGASSWEEEEFSAILSGTFTPLQPTVCRRAGSGVALFYPGKSHELIADSEAGKTWLALLAAKQEIALGHHVYFFDFEDSAQGVVGRLLLMDCPPAQIRQWFHYVRPDEPLTDNLRAALVQRLEGTRPSLAIVDGVTEVMSQHGWGQKDNDDIAAFYRLVLRPIADTGAAVVALDHLPKYDEKGRGAIGGVHKLNGIDGAVYKLEAVHEIAPGREGVSRVTIEKDRPGEVKRHQDNKRRIADLLVDSDDNGVVVELEMPGSVGGKPEGEGGIKPKPITGNGALVLNALQTDEEQTRAQIVRKLSDQKTVVSSSSVKTWLKDLEVMGKATYRAEMKGGKEVHYWTSVPEDGGL